MDLEMAEAIERISERIDTHESSLREEFRRGLVEVRRHASTLNEATRDDIRLVAEAVATKVRMSR